MGIKHDAHVQQLTEGVWRSVGIQIGVTWGVRWGEAELERVLVRAPCDMRDSFSAGRMVWSGEAPEFATTPTFCR